MNASKHQLPTHFPQNSLFLSFLSLPFFPGVFFPGPFDQAAASSEKSNKTSLITICQVGLNGGVGRREEEKSKKAM